MGVGVRQVGCTCGIFNKDVNRRILVEAWRLRAWMLHTPQKKPPRLDREETTLQRLYHPYRRLFHCDGVRKKKKAWQGMKVGLALSGGNRRITPLSLSEPKKNNKRGVGTPELRRFRFLGGRLVSSASAGRRFGVGGRRRFRDLRGVLSRLAALRCCLAVRLGTWSPLALVPGGVRLAFLRLAFELLVLVGFEKTLLILISQDFCAVTKEYDSAGTDTNATPVVELKFIVIRAFVELMSDTRAAEFSYSPLVSRAFESVECSQNLPYSGGAQGPSPLATRSAIVLYHSSLVLPRKSPTTTMVMLSHPTPPVSLLEARQLSIKFSQIRYSSCLAAIPLRTNSITACDDWQSQIPAV